MEHHIKSALLILILMFASSLVKAQDKAVEFQRQLLKDYFLFTILKKANENACFPSDYSPSYYIDVGNYGLQAYRQLDSLTTIFVESELVPNDEKKYETVFLDCLEKYKSEEIVNFVIDLDKYLIE